MAVNKFVIGIVLQIFAVAACSNANSKGMSPIKKLLIDTDGVYDDGVALFMVLEAERLDNGPKIIGITCVNGNTDVHNATLNVLKILQVADRLDIPVYEGAEHPLVLENVKDYQRYGRDGFADFHSPNPPSADLVQKEHAVNAMIDMVKAHPGEISLFSMAPLTNIALAIRMYPRFLDDLQQLIVMGGSTGHQGNVRPGIDSNTAIDPLANFIVFSSSIRKPLTLVPIETTNLARVSIDFRRQLSESKTEKIMLIDSGEALAMKSDADYWYCPDAVAAAIVLDPENTILSSAFYYMDAIYEGTKTAGMTIVDYSNITGNPANVNLILILDQKPYEQQLSKYLASKTIS